MTYEPILIHPDQLGPSPVQHFTSEGYVDIQHPYKASQPASFSKLHNVQYNRELGVDEDSQSTDEDVDASSQSSSDEYFSQTSDSTIATSPISEQWTTVRNTPVAQDDSTKTRQSQQDDCTTHRGFNQTFLATSRTQSQGLPKDHDRLVVPPSEESRNITSCAPRNVPFRVKPIVTPQQEDCVPPSLQVDTSRIACDVQRSRMRPQPTTSEDPFLARRRGRSICARNAPPRLRRDTDQTDAIVKMIVLFCTNLINSIWSTGASADAATQSSGSNVLPLQVFITETLRRSKTSYSTLQIALYYLIILKQCLPPYAAGRQNTSGCRAMQCGRRMFLTALILASKYLQDRNYSARAWSKISGLPLKEINENERRYLGIISWDLHVPKDTFENWSKIVLNVCRLSMDPDVCTQGPGSQPPPGAGPTSSCFQSLKSMCQENLVAMRGWWLSNLRSLCTDIIKCPQRTDKYVLSISPFRDSSYLPKPVIESPWQDDSAETSHAEPTSARTLPRLPSIDSLARQFGSYDALGSPAAKLAMPAPPMLANLPTPQQTPRGMDMRNMWTPQLNKPSLRCRASATALSNLDQRRCPMASLSTCPPPKPKPKPQPRSSAAVESDAFAPRNVPDRSLTSSPESVISDASSVFSFAPRSRSSSISSTSSWMTAGSAAVFHTEKQRAERLSCHLNQVQQQFSHQGGVNRRQSQTEDSDVNCAEDIERPDTAFRVPSEQTETQRPAAPSESSELFKEETQNRSRAKIDIAKSGWEAAQTLAGLQQYHLERSSVTRPSLTRCFTNVSRPIPPTSTQHFLKRSRSESFDHAQEKKNCFKQETSSCFVQCSVESKGSVSADRFKEMVTPTHSYLQPRMPLQYGVQNKRIALQSPSPAATLASAYLQQDIMLQG